MTLTKVAAAVTMASAAVALSGATVAGAETTVPTSTATTTSPSPAATAAPTSTTSTTASTTSTTASPTPTTASHTSTLRAKGQNPAAYYGNPKLGVQIAPGEPGLYPVFGAADQPDLSGFSIDATPATGQPTLPGVTEPQPTCTPGTALAANSQPNVYCETDTDNGYEFPMGSSPETYDFAVSASPQGFVHDPSQPVPIPTSISQCQPANTQGQDHCAFESGERPSYSQVTWFNYIGIFRELTVTVTDSTGKTLSGVPVTLTCTPPAGAPADACPQVGGKSNLSTSPLTGGLPFTVTTGTNGSAAFPGIYLPGTTVQLVATPPAGYQGASTTVVVPSPVSGSGQTGLQISTAAQTPVPLALVLAPTPPPTTTTVPVTTTPSTAAPTTTQLAQTGIDARRSVEGAAAFIVAGSGLVVASRRRSRKGRHFRRP